MRTKDFIRLIAQESDQTIVEAEKFYNTFMRLLEDRILAGEDVSFRELFTVSTKPVPARKMLSALDGKMHELPARKKVCFKTSKTLKDKLIEK